jgi:hypothetical protein
MPIANLEQLKRQELEALEVTGVGPILLWDPTSLSSVEGKNYDFKITFLVEEYLKEAKNHVPDALRG